MNKGKGIGSIYKLYNEYGTYYGSTTKSLKERFCKHKKESNKCTSKILFQNGAIPKIELLEEVEFDNISQLKEREAYYISNLECINKVVPNRTKKEYYQDNKEIKKQKVKEYNEINKEKIKEYLQKNKEKIRQQKKEYREQNKEKIKQRENEYYEKNKDIINKKKKIKITCECGAFFRKDNMFRHKKSKKHLKFIEEKNSTIII